MAEIVEVIELTSTLGIHACNIGVPLLVEVMKEEGIYDSHPTAGKPFDEHRGKLREEFVRKRGYWHQFWEDFLKLDPEFFEAYVDFSSIPWTKNVDGSENGVLEPKVSLIYPSPYPPFSHCIRSKSWSIVPSMQQQPIYTSRA